MTNTQQPIAADTWEQYYRDGALPWDSGRVDDALLAFFERYPIDGGRVLEVGCGTGTNAIWLAQQGLDVHAVDVSPSAVGRARANAAEAGVSCSFAVADFLRGEGPTGPFDVLYDRGCFHTFAGAQRGEFVRATSEVVRPGGLWHSHIGSTEGPPRDGGPPRRSGVEILEAIEDYFELLELRASTFDGHHCSWSLVARRRAPAEDTRSGPT